MKPKVKQFIHANYRVDENTGYWQRSGTISQTAASLRSAQDCKKKREYTETKDRSKWEANQRERWYSSGGHMRPKQYPGMQRDKNNQVIERHTGYTPCASGDEEGA